MRILYIYREKEKNEHSIEAVFDTVAETLKDFGHYVHKWYKPYLGDRHFEKYGNSARKDMTFTISQVI